MHVKEHLDTKLPMSKEKLNVVAEAKTLRNPVGYPVRSWCQFRRFRLFLVPDRFLVAHRSYCHHYVLCIIPLLAITPIILIVNVIVIGVIAEINEMMPVITLIIFIFLILIGRFHHTRHTDSPITDNQNCRFLFHCGDCVPRHYSSHFLRFDHSRDVYHSFKVIVSISVSFVNAVIKIHASMDLNSGFTKMAKMGSISDKKYDK
uniref:Uncharacterized protein n=1 Tax=Glossina pallidipes TaxID=7398 RepID=A0A1A9ZVC4_GLOPL